MTLANEWYYLKNASTIFTDALNTNREALDNLMIWSFVKEKTGYLPKEFKDARLDFDKVYTGATATVARSRTCANAALDVKYKNIFNNIPVNIIRKQILSECLTQSDDCM